MIKKYYPHLFLEDCVYEKKKGEEKKSHIKSKWIISDSDENYD